MFSPLPVAYLTGYFGHRAAELVALAKTLDLVVVDAWWSPRSRVAECSGGRLRSALGDRYVYARSFGHRNYGVPRTYAVELEDSAAGLSTIRDIVASGRRPVRLCRDLDRCHLSVVATELASEGEKAPPLDWDAAEADVNENDRPAKHRLTTDTSGGSAAR